MGLPLTDDNGVVQTIANATPVVWSAGLGYDANGLLCVTSTTSATDVWINGWRRDAQGRLVVSQSTPEGQPFIYSAGWPTDKNTGAIITQQNTPAPTDPRIAGVAVGPLGGVYMTEGGYIWTPAAMFSAGEKGGLWDFSTLANLYQDSAGTTPCTAVGQPIGLVLDTKNGTPQLGPELVTNGDFSNGTTGWTLEAYTTAGAPSGGKIRFSGTAPNTNFNIIAYQVLTVVAGRAYRIDVPQTVVAGDVSVGFYASGSAGSNIGGSNGAAPCIVVATSTTLSITLYVWNGASTNVPFDVTFGPVTAKEIPGNHLTQSTSTKRPTLGRMPATGVRNLLTYTEDLMNAVWVAGAGATKATSTTFNPNAQFGQLRYGWSGLPPNTTFRFSVYVAAVSGNTALHIVQEGLTNTQSPITVTSTPQRFYITAVSDAGGFLNLGIQDRNASGQGTVYMSMAQAELGSAATNYQKVVQPYDITESGVASVYTAYFDGVDDCLVSPSIDFSGTDAMSVFGGFRKTSDAARGMVAELSATTASNNGSFALTAPNAASATIVYESKGTSLTDTSATIAAPADSVISAVSDISADSNVLRRNGVQADSDTGDQGTGNFGNYPLYIGQRNAATLPYKGFLSALCARGAATDATTITNMEQWLAARTPGVTLPTWVGRYNYVTPPTSSIPAAGGIVHGDNLLNKLNFSKTDLDGQTYTGPPLTTGHEVKIGDQVYNLVAPPVDFSSYITLTIEPATQLADGAYPVLVY